MKRFLIIFSVLIVLIVGGAVAAVSFVDLNQYKDQARQQIKKITGYDVALNGDMNLAFLPAPGFSIENVEVSTPAGKQYKELARLGELHMSVSFAELIKGKVAFSSITLKEPDISIEMFEDGGANWKTPEIEALMAKKEEGETGKGNAAQMVSLDSLSITNGRFSFIPAGGEAVVLSDINLDIQADTLTGPFKVKGGLTGFEQALDIDLTTGAFAADDGSLPVKLKAAAEGLGVDIDYAGVVALGEAYDVQGETRVQLSSPSRAFQKMGLQASPDLKEISLAGLLTASPEKISYKNATLSINKNTFKGDVNVQQKPLKIIAELQGSELLNIDEIIKLSGQSGDKPVAGTPGNFFPATLNLPMGFDADVTLSAPEMAFKNQMYKDVAVGLAKQGGAFTVAFKAGEIPGQGAVELTANLKYAARSASGKSGGVTYSEPSLTADIKGRTQNVPQTLHALSGVQAEGFVGGIKTGKADMSLSATPAKISIKSSSVTLDSSSFQVSGSYAFASGNRPALDVSVVTDSFDFNRLTGQPDPQQKSDPVAALKTLSLPYDLKFDVGVQNAKIQEYDITGLRAQGSLTQNALGITNLSAQNFAGTAFKMNGGVGNLKALSDLRISLDAQSSDIRKLADLVKFDTLSLPKDLKSAGLGLDATGSLEAMKVSASIKAMNGEVIARGDVANPLTNMAVDNLALQVKHRNLNELMGMLAPSAPRYASWNKPVDFAAGVSIKDKVYSLNNIKANLGGADVSGVLSANMGAAKPTIKGDLKFADVSMTSQAYAPQSAASSGSGGASKTAPSGARWSKEPLGTEWMHSINFDMSLSANMLTYDAWNLQQPAVKAVLQDGTMSIQGLKAGLFGGQMAMDANIRSSETGQGPVAFDANTAFTEVSLEKLMTALARGSKLVKGQGQVSMQTALKGSGSSAYALVSSLNGNATAKGNAIVLEGFDLTRFAAAMSEETKPGDTVLGLWKGATKGGSTRFDTMDGVFNINQGIVNIARLDLDGPKARVATTGNVNLPPWTIATAHTITLKENPDVPPFTVNISGSLDNPGNTFAQGAINDYISRKINRKLEKIISDKLGLPTVQQAPAQPAEVAPSGGDELAPAPAPAQQQQPQNLEDIKPEDVFRGLLKELAR